MGATAAVVAAGLVAGAMLEGALAGRRANAPVAATPWLPETVVV